MCLFCNSIFCFVRTNIERATLILNLILTVTTLKPDLGERVSRCYLTKARLVPLHKSCRTEAVATNERNADLSLHQTGNWQ